LLLINITSVLISSILGMYQIKIKRIIAYSSINNTSLFLLVFSFNISDGIIDMFVGLILYLLNMFCLLLSLLMFRELGTNILVDNIEILISYRYLYPARVLIFSVCFLSLGSLPPLIGFVSKVVLFKAMFDYSFGIVAFCIILMSVINL